MGDGGQGEPDDRPDPLALTEGDDETADGLPVLDQLEDGPLGGSHPPHHRALGRPEPSVKDVALGVELGEVAGVHRRLGLGRDRLSPVGLPARLATRPVPNSSATVITWATESIRREW
jgi:hypothetical protein